MKKDINLAESLAKSVLEHLDNECSCSYEYTSRSLKDPQCEYCNIGEPLVIVAKKVLEKYRKPKRINCLSSLEKAL